MGVPLVAACHPSPLTAAPIQSMRIEELEESGVRRRNVAGNEILHGYTDDDEYITDEEYEDYLDEDEEASAPGLRNRLTNVLAALAPNRISRTLKTSTTGLMQKSGSMARTAGNLAWIVSTSLILVGVPVLFAYDREKNMAAQGGQMMPLDAPAL